MCEYNCPHVKCGELVHVKYGSVEGDFKAVLIKADGPCKSLLIEVSSPVESIIGWRPSISGWHSFSPEEILLYNISTQKRYWWVEKWKKIKNSSIKMIEV